MEEWLRSGSTSAAPVPSMTTRILFRSSARLRLKYNTYIIFLHDKAVYSQSGAARLLAVCEPCARQVPHHRLSDALYRRGSAAESGQSRPHAAIVRLVGSHVAGLGGSLRRRQSDHRPDRGEGGARPFEPRSSARAYGSRGPW